MTNISTTLYNVTIGSIANYSNQFYNTGCIKEINQVLSQCENFKLKVYQVMDMRLKVAIVLMACLFGLILYIKYKSPKFSQTEFYKEQVDSRLDYLMMLFIGGILTLIFLI